jgi:hypothetical protein
MGLAGSIAYHEPSLLKNIFLSRTVESGASLYANRRFTVLDISWPAHPGIRDVAAYKQGAFDSLQLQSRP